MLFSQIFLCVIGAAMFSRVASYVGFPSVINFVHFPLVFLSFVLVIRASKSAITKPFLYAGIVLFLLILFSSIINEAGFVNALLDFVLLMEAPVFALCIISVKWSGKGVLIFRRGMVFVAIVHLMFILYQRFVQGYSGDDVEGLLIGMGAGSHLSGAIALSLAVYFILLGEELYGRFSFRYITMCIPISILFAATVVFSDAKQVFAVFLVASALLTMITLHSFRKVFFLTVSIFASCIVLYKMSQTVFPELSNWVEIDLLKEGFVQKFSVFGVIFDAYDSFLNVLFGLGPGHTVGRLAMLLPEYSSYLDKLGATVSPLTTEIWVLHQGHYMSNSLTGSSMFSLFFSWAGIFGDIGLVGLSVYLYIYYLVWKHVSVDLFSKFLVITVMVFGWVFQWMEEPQYMLFTMGLIGLRWQQFQLFERSRTVDV
ncbi:MAG: hypothetical protein KBT63_11115 [Porticoccaceae bacterium]|nr:hypothetical protein [Porticoccaceae bacterium]